MGIGGRTLSTGASRPGATRKALVCAWTTQYRTTRYRTTRYCGSIDATSVPLELSSMLLELPEPHLPPWRRQIPLPPIGQDDKEQPPKGNCAHKVRQGKQIVEHKASFEEIAGEIHCRRRALLTNHKQLKHEPYGYTPTKLMVNLFLRKLQMQWTYQYT